MTSRHPIARLEACGITKSFGDFCAVDEVNLTVLPCEIHALLGENGAGKSTLVKIIYGLLQADKGEIRWNGEPVRVASPRAARARGIGMVFQSFSLFDGLSVLENISLGIDRSERRGQLAARLAIVSHSYGLPLDPGQIVGTLSAGERQRVEIIRCLLSNPQLLVLDEPTSVLTPQEAARLFETLRLLADTGCSILYISHKLREIQSLCSQATILRGGRVTGSCDPRQENAGSLARLMIGGAEIGRATRPPGVPLSRTPPPRTLLTSARPAAPHAPPRLSVDHLDLPAVAGGGIGLHGISFNLAGGEILGIAGIAGNGQTELFQALSGERRVTDTMIRLDGRPCGRLGPAARRSLGFASLPEERNGHAAVLDFTLTENTLLTGSAGFGLVRAGLIGWRRTKARTAQIIAGLDIQTTGSDALAATLSGGNLQKFVIGRELMQPPSVFVVEQPSWGVDVHAAAVIHQALLALAQAGGAVLIISQDLDELLALSHRVSMINLGCMSPPVPTADLSLETLGLLMGGSPGRQAPYADASGHVP